MVNRYDVAVDRNAPNNAHAFMLELVGWNRRVLELGAAAGHVTRVLVEQSCRVTAVERDSEASLQLKEIADDVIVGDLNDPMIFVDLQPEFDVLLAGDVLEHLLAPQEVLNRAVQLVKPGGLIVMSIPNVAHADVRLALLLGKWEYRRWGLLNDAHVRFFTLDSIQEMIRRAGLVITEMHRVRIPAFESELAVDRTTIPTQVLDLILTDPEAETYQFVLSAARDDGERRLGHLSGRVLELERTLELAQITIEALRISSGPASQAADPRPLEQEIDRLNIEIGQINSEVERLHQQLDAAEAARKRSSDEFDALVRTKTFRYTRMARQLYGRLLPHQ
jgi:2-polyprenyl-3-methyl-5-hydroxy-6-metoxy-1,4-benzoquinol methylase